MSVRPLILLKDSQLRELHGLISRAIEKWAAEWAGEIDMPVIDCVRAWELKTLPSEWSHFHQSEKKRIWFCLGDGFLKGLRQYLFEVEQRHALPINMIDMAHEAVSAAASALTDDIAAVFGLEKRCVFMHEDVSPPGSEFANGSGGAVADIAIGKCRMLCLLNYECVRALGAASSPQTEVEIPLASLKNAMAGMPLSLPVELGQVEIDVGNFLSLQIGDVIRLNTTVDEPLDIKGPDGQSLLGGYLGSKEKNIAVEIVRLKQ